MTALHLKSLALLTLAACTVVVLDQSLRHTSHHEFEALPDHQLAAVRGADWQYTRQLESSCEDMAKSAWQTLGGTNFVVASQCDATNVNKICVRCEEDAKRWLGRRIGDVPKGTGSHDSTDSTSCGALKVGQCGPVLGTTPVIYDCLSQVFVTGPGGLPYGCSDLFSYMEDQSTGN